MLLQPQQTGTVPVALGRGIGCCLSWPGFSSQVSGSSLLLIKTPVIGLRPNLTQGDLILINHIYKEPTLKKGSSNRY